MWPFNKTPLTFKYSFIKVFLYLAYLSLESTIAILNLKNLYILHISLLIIYKYEVIGAIG